ncbi:hypothetical protein LTR78_003172 [Recurvomyces mirabilis]|uniref:Uncharacterized protein n=1 Tax=Recurvomyces mirabilis TaxID=574656 RepID=A0AAE1C3N0_9PEZI|nr:hypothetical protein LTR78_003172 [Recurvomyces mirabilis]
MREACKEQAPGQQALQRKLYDEAREDDWAREILKRHDNPDTSLEVFDSRQSAVARYCEYHDALRKLLKIDLMHRTQGFVVFAHANMLVTMSMPECKQSSGAEGDCGKTPAAILMDIALQSSPRSGGDSGWDVSA